jgi:SnoaL-like domain
MERSEAQRWLERYVEAWRSNDATIIEGLFSKDVSYRYHAYDEPIVGRDELVRSWLESPDDPDSWEASYTPFVVEGDRMVATGTSRYFPVGEFPERLFYNVFLIEFDDEGRCREFLEYYLKEPS